MKIAMMTNNYKPFIGGVPISVELLSEGLRGLGHSVTVFAPTYKEQTKEDNVMRYHSLLEGIAGGVVIPNPLDLRIEKEFKRQQFDLIHVHHPMLIGRTAIYLSHKYHIPLVFTYHTRYDQYLHYIPPIRLLEKGAEKNGFEQKLLSCIHEKIIPAYLRSFLKHCSHVFVPTDGLCSYLTDHRLMLESDLSVLPTGLKNASFLAEKNDIENIRRKYNAENMPLLVTVSRMAHEKNINFLIESMTKFKEKYQKPFRMLLIGDGPKLGEYQQQCQKRGLPQLEFTGKLPNHQLPAYYHAADAFLFASKTETQGIVILEAFAGSAPVIAVRASGVSDLVIDGKNGFLTPEDSDYFSDRIVDTLNSGSALQHLKSGALETALEYHEETIAQKAAFKYQNILREYNNRNILLPA